MVGGAAVIAIGFIVLVKALSVPLDDDFPRVPSRDEDEYVIASTKANGHQMAARCKALLLDATALAVSEYSGARAGLFCNSLRIFGYFASEAPSRVRMPSVEERRQGPPEIMPTYCNLSVCFFGESFANLLALPSNTSDHATGDAKSKRC
jgi:hypothetical protein